MWICKNKGPTCKVHLYFFIELTSGLSNPSKMPPIFEVFKSTAVFWHLFDLRLWHLEGLFVLKRQIQTWNALLHPTAFARLVERHFWSQSSGHVSCWSSPRSSSKYDFSSMSLTKKPLMFYRTWCKCGYLSHSFLQLAGSFLRHVKISWSIRTLPKPITKKHAVEAECTCKTPCRL